MNSRNVLPLFRTPVAVGTAVCLFLAGWLLGRPAPEVSGLNEIPRMEPVKKATSLQSSTPQAIASTRGTFQDRIAREKALTGMTPENWRTAWREALLKREHLALIPDWAKCDPHGALTVAMEAARHPPAEDQVSFDHQALGSAAINALIRRGNVPAALKAAEEWAGLHNRYPVLDCLHLLVTGDEEQKTALRNLVSAGNPMPLTVQNTGKPLEVLEVLTGAGPPVRQDVLNDLIAGAAIIHPRETAEWILQRRESIPDALLGRAIQGFGNSDMNVSADSTEALGRLLETAPPHLVDGFAEGYVRRKAEFDPEAARRWAEEHVPEGQLPKVLRELDAAAAEKPVQH